MSDRCVMSRDTRNFGDKPFSRMDEALSRLSLGALVFVMGSSSVLAQSAAPGTAIQLPPVVIEQSAIPPRAKPRPNQASATDAPASTAAPEISSPVGSVAAKDAARKLDAVPGGTEVLSADAAGPNANVTLAAQLASVPGIVVQQFFGSNDQPRVQIRGSGLQQNPVERGILVLQDGLPINRADGSYIVGFADPRSAEFTEIYRGYTANRLGATVLGGAINFSSPNGLTSPGSAASAEIGSFGHRAISAETGGRQGDLDGYAGVTYAHRDGYREHNESERLNLNFNVGARINDNISTRVYGGYTDLKFDVVGPTTKSMLDANPKQVCSGPPSCVGPNVLRDDPHRDAQQLRVGSRTTARYGAHLLDIGFGYTHTNDSFTFPISGGVRDTQGGDFTTVLRYAYAPDKTRALPLFEATSQYVVGSADRNYYINNRGQRGALFGANELTSSTASMHAGFNIPLLDRWTLSPGLAFSYATRTNDDTYTGATRPFMAFAGNAVMTGARPFQSTSYDRSYSAWTPSLALGYEIMRGQSLFAAVSRSFEPPTHDDLIAGINGTPNSSPGQSAAAVFATPNLKAQTATTLEGGWKGRTGLLAWNAIAYYSWVSDELLSLRDSSGVSLGAVNADRTTHFGVELGGQLQLSRNISGRAAYTYQDFRFDGDARHGNNMLAGAPRHIVNAAVRYTFQPGTYVEIGTDWVPTQTAVDNANTLFSDSFAVVDIKGSYRLTETVSLYGQVTNIFDKAYASSTLIVDTAAVNQATLLPGDGRGFLAGVKAKF